MIPLWNLVLLEDLDVLDKKSYERSLQFSDVKVEYLAEYKRNYL